MKVGHCQGHTPPTSNVEGLSISRTSGTCGREGGMRAVLGLGRPRQRQGRVASIPVSRCLQWPARLQILRGMCPRLPERMDARGRFLTLIWTGFLGRRAEKMAGGEWAQGTMCHHLKGKGFRSTLVPQWISPSSLW